jgi:assimilatory nitrate reductase catalytic subunit
LNDASSRANESAVRLAPNPSFEVSRGALCIKGWTAARLLNHPDRLLTPLMRNRHGDLVPADWDAALDFVAGRIAAIQEREGTDAIGVFGGGSLTNEKAYLLGKFARVALRTSNIDYNGRFCMSSAAAASIRAFGLDRGLPFPIADISDAGAILLAGGNLAETMPPIMQYFEAQRARGGTLIVVDPRRSPTARAAALHLQCRPGTDAAVANGLLHVLIREGLIDSDFIERRTEGFAEVRAAVAAYWPDRVERITGIPEARLVEAARVLAGAPTAMVLTGRGAEQHAQGVNIALAYINVALALGLPGRRASGYGCVTGQGNGQGGREHGQKADQLPGYRRIDDPTARRQVASVWGVDEADIPQAGVSAYEMLKHAGARHDHDDDRSARPRIRGLLVVGSNPVVSAPDAGEVARRLRSLDLLVVSDFFLSESAELAHVVLPAAQWAEEDGTVTNLEGRVIRRRRAVEPPPQARSDLWIIRHLAHRLGRGSGFEFDSAEAVFEELRRASAGGPADYSGITYDRIDAEGGVFWPCPSEDHPGTRRLFGDVFPTPSGRARFHAVRHSPPAEETDGHFPLILTTGRVLAHYQSGNQTRRVTDLTKLSGTPHVEMHPSAAHARGLQAGDRVTVSTRRGSANFVLKVDPGMARTTVFAPFHWGGDGCANLLTNPALDPVSRMPEFKVCAAQVTAGHSREVTVR